MGQLQPAPLMPLSTPSMQVWQPASAMRQLRQLVPRYRNPREYPQRRPAMDLQGGSQYAQLILCRSTHTHTFWIDWSWKKFKAILAQDDPFNTSWHFNTSRLHDCPPRIASQKTQFLWNPEEGYLKRSYCFHPSIMLWQFFEAFASLEPAKPTTLRVRSRLYLVLVKVWKQQRRASMWIGIWYTLACVFVCMFVFGQRNSNSK